MKSFLVGTRAGRRLLELRSRIELVGACLGRVEQVGDAANNDLAMYLTCRICDPGKVFVDVGAHIGSVIAAVRDHTGADIVAFEAMPDKASQLSRKFPGIKVHACALGEEPGEVPFFVNKQLTGYSSLIRPEAAPDHTIEEIRVPLLRMDDLVSSRDVDVIKIDVEGAEISVLRGASNVLTECRPLIMFESGPKDDEPLSAIWQWLSERDFAVLVPNRLAHEDTGLSEEGFLESHRYPRRTTNYFAVPRERMEEYRARARRLLGVVPQQQPT